MPFPAEFYIFWAPFIWEKIIYCSIFGDINKISASISQIFDFSSQMDTDLTEEQQQEKQVEEQQQNAESNESGGTDDPPAAAEVGEF